MPDLQFDLVVIGAGPGGYIAAIRAAQLGLSTACIEKEPSLGGTCLNIGCIPSKVLLDSSEFYDRIHNASDVHGISVTGAAMDVGRMMNRKDQIVKTLTKGVGQLFTKNKIESIIGTARFVSPTEVEVRAADGSISRVSAARFIIATGSEPVPFPDAPFDEDRIVSSTGALRFSKVPPHLIVIGGGVIGLELGSVWLRLGAQVSVLELAPAILPGMDDEVVRAADKAFRKQGFAIRTGVRVTGITSSEDGVAVSLEGGESVQGDRVLVAVGRRPYTAGLGATEIGIGSGERGALSVDDRYHTGVGEVYAIGDAIGGAMLAHKAEEEGVAAAENAAGLKGHVNYSAVPAVVYTFPEIASVGMTEAEARADGRQVAVGKAPFLPNGRAKAMAETDGFAKVIADEATGRLLGVHIIGPRASDLIAEAALAMEFTASAEDIAISVHAHPTLPEVLKEAALGAIGRHLQL